MRRVVPLHEILKEGVKEGVFPGAVAGIFHHGRTYILSAGYASITPFLEPMEEDMIFDLASLTKPLALGLVLIDLLDKGLKINFEEPLGAYLDVKGPLSNIPLFRFLNHTSGLETWYPFYKMKPVTLKEIFLKITELPLVYPPGKECKYSDLNFYVFTYLLETLTQKHFETLFEEALQRVSLNKKGILSYKPLEKGIDQEKIVPTSYDEEKKKILRGIVEDENTRALGGVSGVAGLFGNVYGILSLLYTFFVSYKEEEVKIFPKEILKLFFEFKDPSSDFALIFMRQSQKNYTSTGGVFSENTVGHLGYTGCSFFIDFERDLIVLLLTNRVHPFRGNELIKEFRPFFHKKVIECL